MTKADLAEILHAEGGFSKKEAGHLVELFFELLAEAICHNRLVKLSRFGRFEVRPKKTRRGRNPQTGATIEICARHVLTFRPSQVLRAALQRAARGPKVSLE